MFNAFLPRLLCGLIVFISLGACTSLRSPALALSKAGQLTTDASAQSLRGVAVNVGGLVEMNLVRQAVIKCASNTTKCDPGELPKDVDVVDANQRLANVILLRVKAINKVNDAYSALQKEAEYDARGELEGAIKEAAEGVNGLAGAVQVAGGPALGALAVAVPVVTRLAGESARVAQNRRLVEASKRLKDIDRKLIELLTAEKELYSDISSELAENRTNVADEMLNNGVADPMPLVNEFTAGLGLGTSAELKPANPRSVVIARTMTRYRSRWAVAVSAQAYDASVTALKALVAEHEKFESDAGKVSLDGVTGAIDDLKGWAEIIQQVQDAASRGVPR